MKIIFDFDDTLFKTTPEFKEHMFSEIRAAGISKEMALARYQGARENEFSLKNFLGDLFGGVDETLYEKIMKRCTEFVNEELLKLARETGKENCYIVTNGELEFQNDKISRSGIAPLFREIHVVPGSKKEIIEKICIENAGEEITFMDDKEKFFTDLDIDRCPNLKTVLYARS